MAFTRRQFLHHSTIAATVAIVPPVLAQPARRILIVGAGAAGLTCAYELAKAGLDVQVFEASHRPGGRMHTLRDPFTDGLYAEAGAQALGIGPGMDYAREFGLELISTPFDPDLGSLSYFKGQRIEERRNTPVNLPFDVRSDEEDLTVDALHWRYRRRPVFQMEGLREFAPPGLENNALNALDNTNLYDFFLEQGASEAAMEAMMYIYLQAYSESPDQISLVTLVRETASYMDATVFGSIAGGNDRICQELASSLGERVHYQNPVRAIRQNESGVTLSIENSGELESVSGDIVVVTPPPPVLRTIDIQPALPEATAEALLAAVGVPVTMTYAQTRSRFWQQQSLNGIAVTDLPSGQIQHITAMQENEKGILASMTYGERASAMGALSPQQSQAQLREDLALLYPDSLDLDEAGAVYAWGDDPWHRCGHVAFRPGTYVDSISAMRQPHGRLFFAGDTVWGVSGYSHSAFESGIEVASAVKAAA